MEDLRWNERERYIDAEYLLGCMYLLNNNSSISTYKDLLHYYYDDSPRSQGGAVQFFNASKKFI